MAVNSPALVVLANHPRKLAQSGRITQALFSHAKRRARRDDDVIQNPHVNQRQGAFEDLRQSLIGPAGCRATAGVVVP